MIIDILIIAIIAISVLIGIKTGLVKSLINFVAIFLSIIIAITFCKPLSQFMIKNTKIDENIQQAIVKIINGKEKTKDEKANNQEEKNIIEQYTEKIGETVNDAKNSIINQTAKQLTNQIMVGIAFIILYILTNIILIILKLVLNIIISLPIINKVDKIGGGIIGAINAIIMIYIILGIVKTIGITVQNKSIVKEINNSHIAKIILDKNQVEKIVTSISKK